jgi:hypothetical protein
MLNQSSFNYRRNYPGNPPRDFYRLTDGIGRAGTMELILDTHAGKNPPAGESFPIGRFAEVIL